MKKVILLFMAYTLSVGIMGCTAHSSGNINDMPNQAEKDTEKPVIDKNVTSDLHENEDVKESDQPNESNEHTENNLDPTQPVKELVVYFSATGNTKIIAEALAEKQAAEVYVLEPLEPYTDEDLNYNDSNSRANTEQNDPDARPQVKGDIIDVKDYEVIYIGFPIWWNNLPKLYFTFFDAVDFSGKKLAPFCTSGGSSISQAMQTIQSLEPNADITEGLRASKTEDLDLWLAEIGLEHEE